MRAIVLKDFGRLVYQNLETPRGQGVLIKVVACGICGSDLSVYKGTPAMRARWSLPLILGHEIAGVVLEGPQEWVNRAVTINPLVPCRQCDLCLEGLSNLCLNRTNIGFHHAGGFAEQIRVPLQQLYPLPEGLPLWKGALTEPLAVALRAVELAGSVLGRQALVLGGGAIGTLTAWTLARAGAVVRVSERNPLRQTWLRNLSFIAEVLQAPRAGFEVVVDSVGTSETTQQAVEAVLPGGQVVLVGLAEMQVSLPLQQVVLQEIGLKGSYVFTHSDFVRAAQLLMELPDHLAILRPFNQTQAAFDELLAGKQAASKVVLVHEE